MFSIIPKKKVSVSDIKQYLVDEYKNNEKQQKEIYKLQDELKDKVKIQIKYETALVTLDEYKKRLEDRDSRIDTLNKQIKSLNNEIKQEMDSKNTKILEYKKLEKLYNDLKSNFNDKLKKELKLKQKDYIKEKVNQISNIRGHLKKEDLIKLLRN